MNSPKPKENDKKEESNELQSAALAKQNLLVNPASGSLLNICSELSQHILELRCLSFSLEYYMEGFMRNYLRLPGTHFLGSVTFKNAAISVSLCARFDGDQIELVELRVNMCRRNDQRIQPFNWSLLPSTFIPKQYLMDLIYQMEAERNYQMEVEPHIQKLGERAQEIRKRLSEPCCREMTLKLRKELFETQKNVPYTAEGRVYDLDREYSHSDSGSLTDTLSEFDQNVESGVDMDLITVHKMMNEQGNLARSGNKIIDMFQQNGEETITMAHVMENKPPFRVSKYFMASLILASEGKVQLQSAGTPGEATTIDELNIKLNQ